MSLHTILESIRAAGQDQVQEIERRAYARANQILAEKRLESIDVQDAECAKAVMPAYRERSRILHQARMQALHDFGDVREMLVDTAIEQLRGRLSSFRSVTTYPAVLRMLVDEALVELSKSLPTDSAIVLEADPRDRKLLRSILADLERELTADYSLNCWGGVVVRSEDYKIVVINTLEARLERFIPYLRRYLAMIFEYEPGSDASLLVARESTYA